MFSADEPKKAVTGKNSDYSRGTSFETVPDWRQLGTFTAGLGIGAMVGAAVALLWAPGSGQETRHRIGRRFSPSGDDSMWENLGRELQRAAARRLPPDGEEIEELEEFEALGIEETA